MGSRLYPYFYFPTTLMFLDDSPEFLSSVGATMSRKFPQVHFNAVTNATDYLLDKDTLYSQLHRFILPKPIDSDDIENGHFLNYDAITALIYNTKRYSEVAVMVVDYSMPCMNGVDFCKKIEDLPVRKIILTGEAGYDIAVEAFNDGVIQRFVPKTSKDMVTEVKTAITNLSINYFVELSKSIAGGYATIHNTHTAYLQVVDQFMQDHDIIEFYQIDIFGSFLGIDITGKLFWLIFSPESEILEYIDIAKDSGAASSITNALTARTHSLALVSESLKKEPVTRWSEYLVPNTGIITTDQKYHYTIITDRDLGINKNAVASLNAYFSVE